MTAGSYNAAFGCMELPAPLGEPEVFIIAGGGTGIPVYRKLQREGIPFATGILHKNDVDYEAAIHLATQIIAEEAFEPIRPETYQRALERMRRCREVICCLKEFGTWNEANERLWEEARKEK